MNANKSTLICHCCGKGIYDTAKDNADFNSGRRDHGFGTCIECGGDKKSKSFKAKIGWGARTFFEARFEHTRKLLKPNNQDKWDRLSYAKKCQFIAYSIQKGGMT